MAAKSKLIDTLTELVAIASVTGEAEPTAQCLDYVSQRAQRHGLQVEMHERNGFSALYAATTATRTPKVLLQAHIDVVPAKADFYKLTQKDDRLYGRGVYDMKFAVACYLQLLEDLQAELKDYDFGIMLTSDEETGGADGAGYLLEHEGYGAGVCILPDGGSNWELETSSNGAWIVRLTANGKSAHGSRPWEGDNAINKLMGVVLAIQELFGSMAPRKNSLTISQVRGGAVVNQVPDAAEATIDMRFVDSEQYQAQRQMIEALVKASGLQLETVWECIPFQVDLKQPEIASFVELAQKAHGRALGKTHSLGCSDARFFVAKGIPTIVIRPTGDGAHSDDEWIDAADFQQFYELLKTYVIQTAKIA